jgi:glycosyltransferase involved in cell wall biosynthesis
MNNLKAPLITVYITNYNYGKYLKQSIESVLNQSFQDFELIIIDDGSTDDSKTIIESYENNPKIKVVYQSNKGLTISNNTALKLSQGNFILRLDSDDYFHSDALTNLLTGFHSDEIGMVFGDWYEVDELGDIIERKQRHNFKKNVTLYDQPAHGACTMFRKSCLVKINGYDESITRQDGYELWLRFIQNFKINNINIPIFYYRQHNLSLTKDEKKLLNTRAEILEFHALKYSKKNKKFFAIVPVRGSEIDSRSRPFLKLCDKYLIDYTLEELIRTKNLSKIIVTTPSKKVIDYINKRYKNTRITCVNRTVSESRINVPLTNTIFDCIKTIKDIDSFDSFLMISIETPFKRSELIDSAINIKKIFDVNTVIGLRSTDQLLYKHNGKGMVPLQKENTKLKLESEQNYVKIQGLILRDLKDYLKTSVLTGSKIGHVIFDQEAALNIKSSLDFLFAEAILKSKINY